jgi:hypothetical protein
MSLGRTKGSRGGRAVAATTLLAVALGAGCGEPTPVPTPAEIFDPRPGHNFRAPTGEVTHPGDHRADVCFTTDGSMPELRDGRLRRRDRRPAAGGPPDPPRVRERHVGDGDPVGIKLVFDWPATDGVIVQTVAGNFTLDCTPPGARHRRRRRAEQPKTTARWPPTATRPTPT